MPSTPAAKRTFRFGIYEVDIAAGELRKDGRKIRLQEQPFQILALLLEHPGEVVTREEIQKKLWPGDTFVDFDHGLNTAINKIRAALGDSAANPRFVETLAKRGYRFMGDVQILGADNASAADQKKPSHQTNTARMHSELHVPMPRRTLVRFMFAAIQLMYLVFYLEALIRWPQVDAAAARFLPGQGAFIVAVIVLVSGALGIAWRCYLLSAVGFDFRLLRRNFERIFLLALLLDELWALAPFLIAEQIGFGAAFAAMAALLYVPFAERTLVRMAYDTST